MSEAWKRLDLGGGGLQSANVRLAKLLKRRRIAYWLLAAFPLGLHRSYLQDPRGAWAFRAITASGVVTVLSGWTLGGALMLLLVAGLALHDIRWIDDRVARLNKRLRMQVYLGQTPGPLRGFRGRFAEGDPDEYPPIKDLEQPAHRWQRDVGRACRARTPSPAEQERLLRELVAARKKRNGE